MHPQLTMLLAQARQEELINSARAAGARRTREPLWAPISVRLANSADESALDRLAQLDSERDGLSGAALIGSVSGQPVAAISLADGRIVADPFARTCDVEALLRLRARQLAGTRSLARSLHLRRAPRILGA